MCGISLIFNADGKPVDRSAVENMNQSLQHRGPDALGVAVHKHVGMGHTRLSIVDIQGGKQPMHSADERYTLSFNGEIYNYRELRRQLQQQGVQFSTESDTEVVLQLCMLHGIGAVEQLRGMFAFALYDRESGELHLVRDRLGIKPLYYHWHNNTLVAASEIKALFASGHVNAAWNRHSVRNYFTYQFAICPHTVFDGVLEIPPGYRLSIKSGQAPRHIQYWDVEFPTDDDYESLDELYWAKKFADALNDAALTHTIGDVPIGAYLSGGIDSSTMVLLLKELYPNPLQTFSIGFTDPDMDESDMFRRIANHLQVANTELLMDDAKADALFEQFRDCLYYLEQPQRMLIDVPHFLLSDLVQRNDYKVIYTGDGADEIFGGYDCFRQEYMRIWGNEIDDPERRRQKYMGEYTQWFADDHVRMLFDLHQPAKQDSVIEQFGCYPAWFDFWQHTAEYLPGIFSDDFIDANRDNHQMQEMAEAMKPHLQGRDMLNQSLYIETKTRLPGFILMKSDRLSMAHGVEARVPFMDHPLVELTARITPEFKLNGMDEKYLLRKMAMPHLPEHPNHYKKRAFYTPIKNWFFADHSSAKIPAYFSEQALGSTGFFNVNRVRALYRELCGLPAATDMNTYYHIMQLEWVLMLVLSIQLLHERFIGKLQGMPN